jgi:hypothetical protein
MQMRLPTRCRAIASDRPRKMIHATLTNSGEEWDQQATESRAGGRRIQPAMSIQKFATVCGSTATKR